MKNKNIYGVAIIPAKTDSTRLSKKNLQMVAGKTLLEHSIEYALDSKYIKHIIVSTESDEVKKICEGYTVFEKDFDNQDDGASKITSQIEVYDRPDHLLKDAEVADVYIDIFQNQFDNYGEWTIPDHATHVVGIQPDHPDRTLHIDKMLEYFVENKYDDLFTVSKDGTRNGSIRIVKSEHVKSGEMSKRVGSMMDDCTNIHDEQDLINAEKNINEQLHKKS